MTNKSVLQRDIVSVLRQQSEFLKHNIATWQLLTKAANEIERLQRRLAAKEKE